MLESVDAGNGCVCRRQSGAACLGGGNGDHVHRLHPVQHTCTKSFDQLCAGQAQRVELDRAVLLYRKVVDRLAEMSMRQSWRKERSSLALRIASACGANFPASLPTSTPMPRICARRLCGSAAGRCNGTGRGCASQLAFCAQPFARRIYGRYLRAYELVLADRAARARFGADVDRGRQCRARRLS